MSVKDWSVTAAANASFYFAENQLPSSVNDNGRGVMADVREWWGQITAGTISGTVGGTGEAITLTPTPAIDAYAANQRFLIRAPSPNTSSAPTLNVSGKGVKTLKQMGLTLGVPAYIAGDMLLVGSDGTDFQLLSVLRPGFPRNDQIGTTYTLTENDRFRHVTFANAGAVAVTIPRTTLAAFINGYTTIVENKGPGTVTFTPTTSTINGLVSTTLSSGQWGLLTADSVDSWRLLRSGTSGAKQSIWVPGGAMTPSTTAGASAGSSESATNKVMRKTMDFADTTVLHAQFTVRMPKSWNAGAVTFIPVWSANSTSTNSVAWQLKGVALANDDTIDAAFGSPTVVVDANTATALQMHQGTESGSVTIGNTPSKGDVVVFDISRDPAHASDTLGATAQLDGVLVLYTTDSGDDS